MASRWASDLVVGRLRLGGWEVDGETLWMGGWIYGDLGGGGFQIFLEFSSLFGDNSHFDEYFSKGLKPPTSMVMNGCLFNFFGSLLLDVGQWLVGLDRIQAVFYKGKLISIGFSTIRLWPVSTRFDVQKLRACFWLKTHLYFHLFWLQKIPSILKVASNKGVVGGGFLFP